MLSCLCWRDNWSVLWLAMFIGAAAFVFATLLVFAWRFDTGASPAWQVGVYYLMLALLFSLSFVVALRHPSPLGEWFRRGALALAVIVPVAVFAAGWVTGGAYIGFRDERAFDLVVVSVSSFMFIWMAIMFPSMTFVFMKALFRSWRRGGSPIGSWGSPPPRGRGNPFLIWLVSAWTGSIPAWPRTAWGLRRSGCPTCSTSSPARRERSRAV